jgi:hypothetical protein
LRISASLALLVHSSRESSLAAEYIAHVKQAGLKAGVRVALDEEDEALLPSARQVLCCQCRRGIMASQHFLPRLLQVLLASMPEVGKFQTPLKLDVEVQTQATLITLHLVTKFPYALTVYRSGLVVPILRLMSSRVSNVSRNASCVIEGLTMNHEVCAAIGEEQKGGHYLGSSDLNRGHYLGSEIERGSSDQKIGGLLIGCVLKRIQTVAAERHCDKAMLNSMKALVHHPDTRGIVFMQLPCDDALGLLQATLGVPSEEPDGLAYAFNVHNTPDVIQTAMSIMESYVNFDERQSSVVMLGEQALGWLGKVVTLTCHPPDIDVTARYSRLVSRGRRASPVDVDETMPLIVTPGNGDTSSPYSDTSKQELQHMGTLHRAQEGATLENKMFLDNVEVKRRRFDRLLQIAHVQAEEEWNSNIKWIMRGCGRKPTETLPELEMWYENRSKSQMDSMEEGIASALLRLGGGDVDKNELRTILRRIHDATLLQIQIKEVQETIQSNIANPTFNAGAMLQVIKAKKMFGKKLTHASHPGEGDQSAHVPQRDGFGRQAARAAPALQVEESEHSKPGSPPGTLGRHHAAVRPRAPPTPGSGSQVSPPATTPHTPGSHNSSFRGARTRRLGPPSTPRGKFKAAVSRSSGSDKFGLGEFRACASVCRRLASMRAVCVHALRRTCTWTLSPLQLLVVAAVAYVVARSCVTQLRATPCACCCCHPW